MGILHNLQDTTWNVFVHNCIWQSLQLNMDMHAAIEHRKFQFCELEELRLFSYENERIYKDKIKQWHDKRIQERDLIPGQEVLLYNSRLKLFLRS